MEELIQYVIAAFVALLTGDRAYQGIKARQHHANGNPGPSAMDGYIKDIKTSLVNLGAKVDAVEAKVDEVDKKVAFHQGFHEGVKEG